MTISKTKIDSKNYLDYDVGYMQVEDKRMYFFSKNNKLDIFQLFFGIDFRDNMTLQNLVNNNKFFENDIDQLLNEVTGNNIDSSLNL
jgi:hypothetical protein